MALRFLQVKARAFKAKFKADAKDRWFNNAYSRIGLYHHCAGHTNIA